MILTLINEELLFADNVPLAITVLGITVSVCRAVIPDAVCWILILFILNNLILPYFQSLCCSLGVGVGVPTVLKCISVVKLL